MIALDDQPFSMAGNLGFTRLMKLVAPEYSLKSQTAYKQQFKALYKTVHIILRDSAANIKKAIKDLEFESVSCIVHQLNLVVNDAIGKQFLVKKTIGDCKKIVGLMNRSDPARKTFKVIQKEIDIEKLPLKLLQPPQRPVFPRSSCSAGLASFVRQKETDYL
uniref:Transposase n=1 Tax=Romanomermis culicivorax TaxID=13658 RepID=A0A915KIN1_ROMCU